MLQHFTEQIRQSIVSLDLRVLLIQDKKAVFQKKMIDFFDTFLNFLTLLKFRVQTSYSDHFQNVSCRTRKTFRQAVEFMPS